MAAAMYVDGATLEMTTLAMRHRGPAQCSPGDDLEAAQGTVEQCSPGDNLEAAQGTVKQCNPGNHQTVQPLRWRWWSSICTVLTRRGPRQCSR
ncbi:hypothetical protein Zmor_001595 [Zophobas morio]|uniref:Uncharacterized protein n=1 Tax=Zophobas morio TaxID=2755281 RepID=A0AA38MSW5_9CUCU|nr:hypothetical protein Zmor_001595 [Zophobas morio]